MESSWKNYHENTSGDYPPRPFLAKALNYVTNKEEALDLGAGALNDCKFLLKEGFGHITVVDVEDSVKERVADLADNRVDAQVTSFDEFKFSENKYDLVNAQYSLPFHGEEGFDALFKKITLSLKQDGIFTGNLFGENDTWNDGSGRLVFHSKDEVLKLLKDLEVIEFFEEEKDSTTVSGIFKHWHILNFIARKK